MNWTVAPNLCNAARYDTVRHRRIDARYSHGGQGMRELRGKDDDEIGLYVRKKERPVVISPVAVCK